MEIQMSKIHQTTYKAIFQHPIAHNLQWHDIRSMLNAISLRSTEVLANKSNKIEL